MMVGLPDIPRLPRILRLEDDDISPVSPAALSPIRWYDAQTLANLFQDSAATTPVTADADPVGSWNDRSGNARHVVQGTSSRRPLYRTNYVGTKPMVVGDGIDDFLRSTGAFAVTQPNWVLLIGRQASAAMASLFYFDAQSSTTNRQAFLYSNSGFVWQMGLPGGNLLTLGSADTNLFIAVLQFNGASSIGQLNGSAPVTGNADTTQIDGMTLFGNRAASSGFFLDGGIGELAQGSGLLSEAQRLGLLLYAAQRWL